LGKLLVLPANVRLDWKVIGRDKHSSLFVYNLDPQVYWKLPIRC
jgi:hypothetical protein